MSATAEFVSRARAELAANPRLRLGAWAIVAILCGYVTLTVQPARVEQAAAAHAATQARLDRARELLARQDWQERLAAARAVERDLAGRLWQADNEGLAQARLRQAIDEMVSKTRLAQPRVEVGLSRAVPDVPGVWQVQVRVASTSGRESALRFLHAIAGHPRILVEEQLTFDRRSRNLRRNDARVEALLSAYFAIGPAAGENPGRPDA